ncbi:family 2 glycosyl transferase [Psychromarinibacter sp. C21-152]|uniref:Family 2 glycosyl transferase n=1 Tax=Psychromarinibacter sediminicola TaxID=3033385 RepID=A0AAE3NU54_9RHOB|nr:glycosyltransferase family 2 protein [Psychromarinibacter sediminicola]MDF0602096.1 family 2 glycosyl transferase [Psychromarinibacter sediminicola]
MSSASARIAVLVASKGRSDILRDMIPWLNAQTLLPVSVTLAVTEPADADFDLAALLDPRIASEVILSPPGSCRQRNAALDRVGPDIDYVVFWDDDFFPSRHALAALAEGFARFPDVDGITGDLIADGIGTPGIPQAEARRLLDDWDAARRDGARPAPRITGDTFGLYGCNMAYRRARVATLRFDERLPLYGWQEDVDFARQLPGRRVEMTEFTGVHLGTKSGRETSGERLGYSQVVNPYYLWRKGTLSAGFSARLVLRNLLANAARSLKPEPWVDRKGRLRGNWIGLRAVLVGRANPEHILNWPRAAR